MRVIEATEYWTVTLSFQYSLVPGDKVKSITWKHLSKGGTEIKTSSGSMFFVVSWKYENIDLMTIHVPRKVQEIFNYQGPKKLNHNKAETEIRFWVLCGNC